MRFFNIAGPCIEGMHYMLPPLDRIPEARGLVDRGSTFVVHAPRQSGKTTALRALAKTLTEEGRFVALAFSCETAAMAGDDYAAAQRAILSQMQLFAGLDLPPELGLWPTEQGLRRFDQGLQAARRGLQGSHKGFLRCSRGLDPSARRVAGLFQGVPGLQGA